MLKTFKVCKVIMYVRRFKNNNKKTNEIKKKIYKKGKNKQKLISLKK